MLIYAIILSVIAVPMTVFGLRSVRRLLAESARPTTMPDTVLEAAFRGGMSSTLVNASAPLVRLEFFDWGVRLRSSWRLFRRLVPVWEARYEDLATVQLIQGVMGYSVRLESTAGAGAVLFWTTGYAGVMDRLADHGVPVDRKRKSIRQAGGVSGPTG